MAEKLKDNNIGQEAISLGVEVGLFLSTTYALFSVATVFLVKGGLRSFPLPLILVLSAGILFAAIPSIVIGDWTGMIIGKIAKIQFAKRFSKAMFTFISVLTCSLTAILIHVFFGIKIVLSFEPSSSSNISFGIFETYPFLFGIPTIIYIIAGGWFGWTIYSRFVSS